MSEPAASQSSSDSSAITFTAKRGSETFHSAGCFSPPVKGLLIIGGSWTNGLSEAGQVSRTQSTAVTEIAVLFLLLEYWILPHVQRRKKKKPNKTRALNTIDEWINKSKVRSKNSAKSSFMCVRVCVPLLDSNKLQVGFCREATDKWGSFQSSSIANCA